MLESKCRSQQPQQSNSNPDLCDNEVKNKGQIESSQIWRILIYKYLVLI